MCTTFFPAINQISRNRIHDDVALQIEEKKKTLGPGTAQNSIARNECKQMNRTE